MVEKITVVEEKNAKVVVTNDFFMSGKNFKRGDVVNLKEFQVDNLEQIKLVKKYSDVSKDELANLNKVDTAPDKGKPAGKNK